MNSEKRCARYAWLIRYTIMFAALAAAFIACFALFGKHMVGVRDGVHQHFTALYYVRDAIRDLIAGNGFKMVDLQLGQGLDTIGTLAYYGLFDPINWIAALFSVESMEICYGALILARLYLIGLFFMMYLRKINLRDAWAVSIAGLVYVGAGFFWKGVPRHPFFADGGIYLALMLIAVERVMQDRKWLMFPIVTALMLITNYYFAFQTTILVVAYIIVRLACTIRRDGVKRTAARSCTMLGTYLLGAALSAVVFLPVLKGYLGNARLNVQAGYSGSMLHYGLLYYIKMIAYMCAPYATTGEWMHQNFCPLVLFALIVLFGRQNRCEDLRDNDADRMRQMRALFVIVCAFACVPAFGKLFNGMGYVCNRWCYGFAFSVCVVLAWALPKLNSMETRDANRVFLVAAIFAAFTIATAVIRGMLAILVAAAAVAIMIFAALIVLRAKKRMGYEKSMRITAVLATGCCCVYIAMIYLPLGGSFAVDYGKGRFYDTLMNEIEAETMRINDPAVYRVDTSMVDDCHATVFGYNGTGFYWSVVPKHVYQYYRDMHLSSQETAGRLCGLGGNAALNAVAGVKYALRIDGKSTVLPYGYQKIDSVVQADGDIVDIYENSYTLSIGYVFDQTLSEEAYQMLNPADKQLALLTCAVASDGETPARLPTTNDIAWTIAASDGARIENQSIIVEQNNGWVELAFTGDADSETIVSLSGLRCTAPTDTDGVRVTFESDAGKNYGSISDPSSNFAHDQAGMAANIGYSETGLNRCRITFAKAGEYTFDGLNVYCLSMRAYRDAVERLAQCGMTNVTYENNRIRGELTGEGGVLQIAVPYSEGWHLMIDGETAELFRCGGMYMGARVTSGAHRVELTYETPGLRTGAILSACAVAMMIVLQIICAGKRKKRRAD